MFNNCNRVLIENVSRNSVCFSFKPFVLLSTYARSIYQVVCVRSPLATVDFVSLSVFWWTHSSIWGTTPSCHFRSNFYIDELTKIYHGIVSCKCYSPHFVKVRGREKGKKKQGPTQKLFLGLNMFVLCPFSGQHFTGKINDNWQAQNKG